MSLLQIGIFCAVALLIRAFSLFKQDWATSIRQWSLLAASLIAIYWLQPANSVRYMDFWLPTVIIGIVVVQWAVLMSKEDSSRQTKFNHRWCDCWFGPSSGCHADVEFPWNSDSDTPPRNFGKV